MSEAFAPLPCVICGKESERAFPDGPIWDENAPAQPYGAVTFYSHGQYGSTVWDSVRGIELLQINVCDECLIQAALRKMVILAQHIIEPPKYEYKWWIPRESD